MQDISFIDSFHYLGVHQDARQFSDAACLFVISHEFAHVVLRHQELSPVVESLKGGEAERIYTEENWFDLKEWHEDEADLLAWLSGFREEYEAFLEAYHKVRRARWCVDTECGVDL